MRLKSLSIPLAAATIGGLAHAQTQPRQLVGTAGYLSEWEVRGTVVEGRLTCWAICEQGHWWGLVTYAIAYGPRRRSVTHWIPAWVLKRKPERR